jgi:hypothetical protein
MTTDDRMTTGFFLDVIDVLERRGYHQHDRQHTGQAMGVIRDLAHVYEGTREAPYGTYLNQAQPPETGPPGPEADQDAVLFPAADARTIVTALDEAALYKRHRVATCADCADQSCGTCQWRLQAAETYARMAAQMTQAAETSQAAKGRQPEPDSHPQPAAELEAGQ